MNPTVNSACVCTPIGLGFIISVNPSDSQVGVWKTISLLQEHSDMPRCQSMLIQENSSSLQGSQVSSCSNFDQGLSCSIALSAPHTPSCPLLPSVIPLCLIASLSPALCYILLWELAASYPFFRCPSTPFPPVLHIEDPQSILHRSHMNPKYIY